MQNLAKKQIRDIIKEKKQLMSLDEIHLKSSQIQNKLISLEEYHLSKDIYIYINFNQEVITTDLIQKALFDHKNVYIPKIHNDEMKFHKITSLEGDLVPSKYGILEPTNDLIDHKRCGLLIMPGLAFDLNFHRIGYGGGYYDKYLSLPNRHIKVALAYDFQVLDHLDTDEFDKTVDMIVTNDNIYKI